MRVRVVAMVMRELFLWGTRSCLPRVSRWRWGGVPRAAGGTGRLVPAEIRSVRPVASRQRQQWLAGAEVLGKDVTYYPTSEQCPLCPDMEMSVQLRASRSYGPP
ncbi:hypothetical protein GCM10009566_63990 [Streptomyces murinus]